MVQLGCVLNSRHDTALCIHDFNGNGAVVRQPLNNHGVTVRLNVDHNPPFVRDVTSAQTFRPKRLVTGRRIYVGFGP